MRRIFRISLLSFFCWASFFACRANSQTLKTKWSKQFAQPVAWYARTSPKILVVMVGNKLIGLDETDGNQLWMLTIVESTGGALGGVNAAADRGRNIVEVPGMGVLLLNRVMLPGDTEGKLVAVNLTNGKRLWDQPQIDDLMTAVPVYETGHVVLVSRRVQKKILAGEMIASAAVRVPLMMMYPMLTYPYRFEFEKVDLATGKVQWQREYERTFTPGTASASVFDDHFYIYFGNKVMTCLDLTSGKFLWEDGAKFVGNSHLALPIYAANGKLIYTSKAVRAVDPVTRKEDWSIEELGRVTGIVMRDGVLVALGEKKIAAVDIETGEVRWVKNTHGHTTNLVWDKDSDAVLYTDWKGLHSIEVGTGKSLLDAHIHAESLPNLVQLASPELIVTIATADVRVFNFKTGKRVYTEGKISAFFRSDAFLDNWPMPDDGEEFVRMTRVPSSKAEWEGVRKTSLLSQEHLKFLEPDMIATQGYFDAYETVSENGSSKVWWIDPQSSRQIQISPSGEHHEVDRNLGMVFGSNKIILWGAAVVPEEKLSAESFVKP